MRRYLVILFSCLCCCFITGVLAEERGFVARKLADDAGHQLGDYRALIIGINHYQDQQIPQLKTAENDAKQLANVLKEIYGFSKVELLLNKKATRSSIQKSLRRLATKSKKNDSVLIYYAGHGDQDTITGDGWWVPADATSQDPSTYIDNSIVQKYVRAIPARHVLLISDSCFSGTLFGQARSMPRVIDDKYYASLYKERSRWGITSGNLTPVADSGSGGHSIFAWQFLKALRDNDKNYMTPREIYQKIAPVIRNNSEQMPITNPLKHAGDAGGEFVFIRAVPAPPPKPVIKPAPVAPTPVVAQAPVAAPATTTADFAMWQVIRESNNIDELKLFIETYPNSPFKSIAAKRLESFQTQKAEVNLKRQLSSAQQSMKRNTLSGYDAAFKQLTSLTKTNPNHSAVKAAQGELERRVVRYIQLNLSYGTNLKQCNTLVERSLASSLISNKKQFQELQRALKRKEEMARKKPKPKKEEVTDVSIGF